MIYIAKVAAPRCPIDQIHVALFSYFPQAPHGDRPFVWRIADGGRSVVFLSRVRPTTACAAVTLQAGVTLSFALTYKRVRNVDGGKKVVEITSMPELRERLIRWTADRGAQIGFVRLDRLRRLEFLKGVEKRRVSIPIVDAEGTVLVTDVAKFEQALVGGGPGTGKVYGCGLWWLPELMQPVIESIGRAA